MPYRIRTDRALPKEIKRIAHEQIERACAELDTLQPRHERAHGARQRIKRVRGLLRLVRNDLGDAYPSENRRFRDMGHRLAPIRDAQALVETLDRLSPLSQDTDTLAAIRRARTLCLAYRDGMSTRDRGDEHALREVHQALALSHQRIDEWPKTHAGFRAIRKGLRRVYRRGRQGYKKTLQQSSVRAFHNWRKRVKYLRDHLRLIRDSWPRVLKAHCAEARRLARILGHDHDLAVLRAVLLDPDDPRGAAVDSAALVALIDRRQSALRRRAQALGARLYAEKPKCYIARLACYWDAIQPDSGKGCDPAARQDGVPTPARRVMAQD